MKFATVLVALCIVTLSTSFSPVRFRASRGVKCITSLQCEAEAGPAADGGASTGGGAPATKGFGKAKAKVEKESDEFTDNAGTRTYATQQKRGVPEYNIFLRPAGGGDEEWVPVGSMTIPRDTSVPKAVFEVEGELLKGTYKLYPKLKAYSDVRSEDQRKTMFEYVRGNSSFYIIAIFHIEYCIKNH